MLQTLVSPHIQNAAPVSSAYKVDISRGERIGRVSSEWFSRPDDERYLSLTALHDAVRARADRATARTVETRALRVEANRDNAERLTLTVPGRDAPIAPTNWSFGQMCSLVGAPAAYLRQLPAPLAGINLQHGLLSHRAELVKTLEADDGRVELRAVTGPDYGRIWDHELVAAVMRIAGDGVGDTRWKVPGLLDWSTMTHNPFVEVTKDTTTLYASDRDVFLFLVDDTHPIEAGRLPNGDPDLYFRGFYCWNSEVGSKTLGIASFFLRAVCMNRNIWGSQDFQEITIRHSKFAAHRFAHQAAPALQQFADSSPAAFVSGVRAAREQVVARKDEDRELDGKALRRHGDRLGWWGRDPYGGLGRCCFTYPGRFCGRFGRGLRSRFARCDLLCHRPRARKKSISNESRRASPCNGATIPGHALSATPRLTRPVH